MAEPDTEKKAAQLEPELRDMKIEEAASSGEWGDVGGAVQVKAEERDDPTAAPFPPPSRSLWNSPTPSVKDKMRSTSSSPNESEREEIVGGDITLKMEPGKAPKLARTAAQKVVAKPPPLYLDLPDVSESAKETFVVIPECTYANKSLGTTDRALECDCSEEWDPVSQTNNACGEDSDCINRATKMECVGDCGCGSSCQNQRFMRKQYADVSVIKTDKKGFGLRANHNLKPGDFIFEYIGEVIDERSFRRRMHQYDEEGIKHFYFMSLTKGEFVDATKKGNLGRFCNHSCNPNCYVDKWVVGDRLRMGIFAERKIKAGEELVFNYNVDRYGADPQPCYCGEPNCTGFIGGKTQTDNATKLSHATIEALGIDGGDGWDTAVAKKPRKKKAHEDDEEYINDIKPKSLEESGVNKVMAALRQCTEKWVAVKLLSRIQDSGDDEKVGHRVIRVHGYEILKSTISAWKDDANVVLQALDILHRLPRITRNKIQDSKIEETIEGLKTSDDERVRTEASSLLEAWSKLEVAYRIPRMKRDPNASTPLRENHFERREKGRERSQSRTRSPSIAAPKGPAASNAPTAPRSFQRNTVFNAPRGPRPRPALNPLPPGWFQATSADNGAIYYYNSSGVTQWTRPTLSTQTPPPQTKIKTNEQKLQEIISSITQNATSSTPQSAAVESPAVDEPKEESSSKSEKWKKLPLEKQEKLYEATLHPHVMSVVSHYRKKFDKEDLKRLSKEVAKKLVRGDYKHGKVKDPTAKLEPKHERTVKKFVKDYMDKAVQKKTVREVEKKDDKHAKEHAKSKDPVEAASPSTPDEKAESEGVDEVPASPNAENLDSQEANPDDLTNGDLKRKREGDGDLGSPKRTRTNELAQEPVLPPPPPPPPTADMPVDGEGILYAGVEDSAKPVLRADGCVSPMQLATPPTTISGSSEHESDGREATVRLANGMPKTTIKVGGVV